MSSARPTAPLNSERPRGAGIVSARVLPLILILIYAAQCAWFIGTQSFTIDEPFNVSAGLSHWHANWSAADDNPPGARLLCTVLLLGSRSGRILAADRRFVAGCGLDPYDLAWRTRSINVLLGIALGIALWAAARRYFSVHAANFALALYAVSPPLIAHFSIVGTDGIAALMLFVTAVQVVRFRRTATWRQALLSGVVLGGLLLSKLYMLPMFALALLLMALPRRMSSDMREGQWSKAGVALCVSFFVLWATYGFDVSRIVVHGGQAWIERHGVPVTDPVPVAVRRDFSLRLAAPDFLNSIVNQLEHGREGHTAYLLGKMSDRGWRSYFPIAVALKWPTVVLLLGVAAAALAVTRRLPLCADIGIIALFPAAFFVMAIFSTVNIGDRYVLSVYPFVLLFVAGVWEYASHRTTLVALLVVAVALNAADSLRCAPGYLSYFTVFIRPDQTWRYLGDSSLDWGQSLIALHQYQQNHPGEVLHLASWGNSVSPELYGIRAVPFGERDRPSGTVVVSAGSLTGQFNRNPQAYRWVLRYPRKALLNHTFYVFDVPSLPKGEGAQH